MQGIKIAEKTVGNYMREEGIRAIWVSDYVRTTIDLCFDKKLKNILNWEFNPTHSNYVWVTDITYCHTLSGSNICYGPIFKGNYWMARF